MPTTNGISDGTKVTGWPRTRNETVRSEAPTMAMATAGHGSEW